MLVHLSTSESVIVKLNFFYPYLRAVSIVIVLYSWAFNKWQNTRNELKLNNKTTIYVFMFLRIDNKKLIKNWTMNIFSNLSAKQWDRDSYPRIWQYTSDKKQKNISNEFIKTEYYWVIILIIIIVEKGIIIFHVTIVKQINILILP